jgi:hypothetical protein
MVMKAQNKIRFRSKFAKGAAVPLRKGPQRAMVPNLPANIYNGMVREIKQ